MIPSKEPGRGLILSRYSCTLEPKEVFTHSSHPEPLLSTALNINGNVCTYKEMLCRGTRSWIESNQKTTPFGFRTLPAVGLIPN